MKYNRIFRTFVTAITTMLSIHTASPVIAATSAITINPSDENTTYFNIAPQTSGQPMSVSLIFEITSSIEIYGLGIWDPAGNVSSSPAPHQITIFDGDGAVVSASINQFVPASMLTSQDGFVFIDITPTILGPGLYDVAAHFPGEPAPGIARIADFFFFDLPQSDGAIDIFDAGAIFGVTGPTSGGSGGTYFSPNFLFDVVPEPSVSILFGFSVVGLVAHRRRTKQVEQT